MLQVCVHDGTAGISQRSGSTQTFALQMLVWAELCVRSIAGDLAAILLFS